MISAAAAAKPLGVPDVGKLHGGAGIPADIKWPTSLMPEHHEKREVDGDDCWTTKVVYAEPMTLKFDDDLPNGPYGASMCL